MTAQCASQTVCQSDTIVPVPAHLSVQFKNPFSNWQLARQEIMTRKAQWESDFT
jgi:hypothetical protein